MGIQIQNDKFVKRPLESGWYYLTITQSYFTDDDRTKFTLCFTVDTGQHAYQNVLKHFDFNLPMDIEKLYQLANGMGFTMWITDTTDPLFEHQFIALRTYANIYRMVDEVQKVIKNVIVENTIADRPAQYNVLRKRDETIFTTSKQYGTSKLPLR